MDAGLIWSIFSVKFHNPSCFLAVLKGATAPLLVLEHIWELVVLVLAQKNSKYCHRQNQGKQLAQTNLIYERKKVLSLKKFSLNIALK